MNNIFPPCQQTQQGALAATTAADDGELPSLLEALRDHRPAIAAAQWAVVALYLLLLLAPVLGSDSDTARRLGRYAEALFWGIWWPGVILSMMLVGQFWCGLLCPDGTLTEFVSRHGRAGKIPHWLRWPALPLAAFAVVRQGFRGALLRTRRTDQPPAGTPHAKLAGRRVRSTTN